MQPIRAFIAIELPESAQQALQKLIDRLAAQNPAFRWLPAANIHLTLKFLGDISSSTVVLLQKTLQAETLQHSRFEIALEGLGAFPGTQRPRVIWVGVRAPAGLEMLQKGVDSATRRLGLAGEERPFSPHLTLARVSPRVTPAEISQLGANLAHTPLVALGTAPVTAISLFRSDLHPSGAVYTRLYEAHLKS